MKSVRPLFVALVLMLISASAAAQTVTFGDAGLAPGDQWSDTSSTATTANASLNDSYRDLGAQPPKVSSKGSSKTVTVTGVVGNDKINEFDVSYSAVTINGSDASSLFAGKVYRVSVNGNHVDAVVYAGGGAPTEAESNFIKVDNARVGQFRAMRKTFGGKTVTVGDVLRASHPEDLIDVDAGFSISDFRMTLASVSGEGDAKTATFNLAMTLANSVKRGRDEDDAPFTTSAMSMSLTGTLTTVVKTSRITAISLSGPTTFSGRKGTGGKKGRSGEAREMVLSGSGNASISSSYTYP